MGFKYPNFQKDYEDEAKAARKSQLSVLWWVIIVCLVIIVSYKAAIAYMKNHAKTVTVTIKQAPTVKQEIKPPASAVPSTPIEQTQSAPTLQNNVRTIFKCKSEKNAYIYQGKPCPERSTKIDSWISIISQAPPSQPNIQQKIPPSFSIQQSPHGYMTQGSANSVPVVFQVDTGAAFVSIPQEIAYRAGMICIKQAIFDTANGAATGCESIIDKMTFGVFTIMNVKAIIMPNLKQPLLGMNALSMFHIEHTEGIMKVTYKR